jgi:hypothetical protein
MRLEEAPEDEGDAQKATDAQNVFKVLRKGG